MGSVRPGWSPPREAREDPGVDVLIVTASLMPEHWRSRNWPQTLGCPQFASFKLCCAGDWVFGCCFYFCFCFRGFFFFLFGEIANDGLVTSRLILSTDGSQRLSPIFQHLAMREKLFSKESHFPWVSLCWSALFSLCQLCRQLLKSWKLSICECPTVQAPYLRRFRAAHPLTY